MTLLNPSVNEYDLLSSFIEEGLLLMGQECSIRYVTSSVDKDNNKIFYYSDEEVTTTLLYVEDMTDVKMKKQYTRKEKDSPIEVYISLKDSFSLTEKAIVTCTPKFYNAPSKFIVTNIFGQPNTTYSRCLLVPYRESLAVSENPNKDIEDKVTQGTIIVDRGILKR